MKWPILYLYYLEEEKIQQNSKKTTTTTTTLRIRIILRGENQTNKINHIS